jgi:hypothetical protein
VLLQVEALAVAPGVRTLEPEPLELVAMLVGVVEEVSVVKSPLCE